MKSYYALAYLSYCLPLLLVACQTQPAAEHPAEQAVRHVVRTQPLLGTFITISAYGRSEDTLNRGISAAFDEFKRMDRMMSVHRKDSELSALNANAASQAVTVSQDLFLAVSNAVDIARQTGGAFDPTVKPIVELWGFIWKDYRMPSKAELEKVLPLVNYRLVELDVAKQTVHFLKPWVTLDLGGIGKGIAVDHAISILQAHGVTHAMVKAGGDLRVIGLPPGRKDWEILLEDPKKAGERQRVRLRGGALSTSGNYENYFVVEGVRYSHILDPRTGLPARGLAACTVEAPTCTESDALATAFIVMGEACATREFGGRYRIRFTKAP